MSDASPARLAGRAPLHSSANAPQVSVVMSTYNRGELLDGALRSVLDQPAPPSFELIVVDNNSTDNTRQVIERIAAADARVRYVFEPRQGSSHGRNAGIRAARAALIAFIDDDVRADPGWLAVVEQGFRERPEADVIGGRVLPLWPTEPPAWLTPLHWSPLALLDFGPAPFEIDRAQPLCLVSANLAVRRSVVDAVGGFSADFQLVGASMPGSVEDHEFLLRVLRSGRTAVYEPRMIVHAEIQPKRLGRAYHRSWHTGHGHFHSLLRTEDMEQSRFGALFGVPAHLYRQALGDVVGWIRCKARGLEARAFQHELRLRFFKGFFRTRRREFFGKPRHQRREELLALLRRILPRPAWLASRRTLG